MLLELLRVELLELLEELLLVELPVREYVLVDVPEAPLRELPLPV